VIIPVDDLSDSRLDDYRNVPDPELLRTRGIFIAEGRQVVRRLIASPRFRTRSVLLTAAASLALADVVDASHHLPIYVVSQEAMDAITGFNIHRGCLAVGERPAPAAWLEVVRDERLVVVLERISNADNVGGIFRNAAAFGAGAILLGPACADPLYRKTIRTSMAAALTVPFAALPDWPGDLLRLRDAGFTLLALTPSPSAPALREAIVVAPPFGATAKAAVLVGHEGEGLSTEALNAATTHVRIPMADGVDSLNVAAAAAIGLYELSQRCRA
jgi:tRNA G18 (ribose-2'-O)-methylase SpoU